MKINDDESLKLLNDPRFSVALDLFNKGDWYLAHDAFEELWHEISGPERKTIQGILQVAVAQVHLESENKKGATILYGEGLGRLKTIGIPDLGLDLVKFCICVEKRLKILQCDGDPNTCSLPVLSQKSLSK